MSEQAAWNDKIVEVAKRFHDNYEAAAARLGCSPMCCALAAAERERDSALADLAALRGKVEEAVALHFRDEEKWDVDEGKGWLKIPVCAACGEQYPCPTLAILSPPEGP